MLISPGGQGYSSATQPHNSRTAQRPAFVSLASRASDIADAVNEAVARSLRVVPQATGHGAGASVDDGDILVDTARLNSIDIDPQRRVATVGAGVTWGALNAEAEKHGLIGPAGSSPSVSVAGYTFGGGIGWLVRRNGMASSALRRVEFVDGLGRARIAEDDADDPADREAMWSFRGAGGVGVATRLEIDLFPAPDLHAGALLWRASDLEDVTAAWSAAIEEVGPGVSSSLGVLHVPPAPVFPEELRGTVALHLAIADPDGPGGASALLTAMRAAATPVSDSWGPSDAARLGTIHLDPTGAVPALGTARWLDDATPGLAAELFSTAVHDASPIVMMELRHVACHRSTVPGALTTAPSSFLFHAVGAVGRSTVEQIESGFAHARAVWSAADVGFAPGSWMEGAASAPDSLPPPERERARAIADAVDPDRRVRRARQVV